MYKNLQKNNGWISEPACIERRIPQECSALFLLYLIDMLAQSSTLS